MFQMCHSQFTLNFSNEKTFENNYQFSVDILHLVGNNYLKCHSFLNICYTDSLDCSLSAKVSSSVAVFTCLGPWRFLPIIFFFIRL